MNRTILIALLGLSAMVESHARAATFEPKGWRVPTEKELSQEWRSTDQNRFARVSLDLNGDGIPDFVGLFISKDANRRVGFFAFISQENGRFKEHLLDEKENSYIEVLGVAPVKPGSYPTACGRSGDCEPGDIKTLVVRHGAVRYFKVDDAESYFYWDAKTASLKYVSIED